MALKSMALTPDEAKEEMGCCASPDSADDDAPKYPYGLTLNLDDEVLAKLGITTPPTVGTRMMVTAMVNVTSTSQYATQSGTDASVNLQITDMDLTGAPASDQAQRMYPGMNP
jgi:hypothetical protein